MRNLRGEMRRNPDNRLSFPCYKVNTHFSPVCYLTKSLPLLRGVFPEQEPKREVRGVTQKDLTQSCEGR